MAPVSEWTLEVQRSKQVGLVGMDDKREITSFYFFIRKAFVPSSYLHMLVKPHPAIPLQIFLLDAMTHIQTTIGQRK